MNHLFSNAKVINPRLKIDFFLEIVFPIIVLNKGEVSWQASLLSNMTLEPSLTPISSSISFSQMLPNQDGLENHV